MEDEEYLSGLRSSDWKHVRDAMRIENNETSHLISPIKLQSLMDQQEFNPNEIASITSRSGSKQVWDEPVDDESSDDQEEQDLNLGAAEINVILNQSQLKTIDEENSLDILSNSKRSSGRVTKMVKQIHIQGMDGKPSFKGWNLSPKILSSKDQAQSSFPLNLNIDCEEFTKFNSQKHPTRHNQRWSSQYKGGTMSTMGSSIIQPHLANEFDTYYNLSQTLIASSLLEKNAIDLDQANHQG